MSRPRRSAARRAAAILLLAGPLLLAGGRLGAAEGDDLARRHRAWLEEVALLLTEEERSYFLSLEEDFRRDAFIEEFWRVRDPDPSTARNELKITWDERIHQALSSFGSLEDMRARVFLFNGEPGGYALLDGRVLSRCLHRRLEIELWFYGGSERTRERFALILYRPLSRREAPYELWTADRALRAATRRRLPSTRVADLCAGEFLPGLQQQISEDLLYYLGLVERVTAPPEPASEEWVATFAAGTTDLPAGAETFEITVEFDFPGRNQNRTAVEGVIGVPAEEVTALGAGGSARRELALVGEVVRDGRLFETFRYRFEIPHHAGGAGGESLPLVFLRYLRPGTVRLLLKVEDLYGRRFARLDLALEIPSPDERASQRRASESPVFRLLAEAADAAERGQRMIRLLPLAPGQIQVGGVRLQTVTAGDIDHVTFWLDGVPLMTKQQPPFSVELDLGDAAAPHRLRAVAHDADGVEVASDELLINQGGQRFRVRLTEPRSDRTYGASLSAVAQVEVPDGATLDRVEIFLGEERVATLYQPPFVQALLLPGPGLTYVRAVGYLVDGNSTEDVVFVNAPDYFEQIEVQYVELYTSVLDRDGRPVLGLGREDFRVFEDGVPQDLRRFEVVRDLPIHAGLLIDSSASMEESLPGVAEAALAFVEQTIESRDRVALFSFAHRPEVRVRFTNRVDEVSRALTALRASGGTALYDSLVFALHYFDGVKGQKALLLLSDGKDEASRFGIEEAVEVAQRVGVTVYVVGLREASRDKAARRVLRQIAEATGGSAYFIDDAAAELAGIYAAIQEELRSQYLLAYQSTSSKGEGELRRIRVEVSVRGAEVRTLSGYYP